MTDPMRGRAKFIEDALEGGIALAPAAGVELVSGRLVGAHRIVRLLGRGGMGEVYLAERADGRFQQSVAIKVMRPEAREHLRRFEAERQILARLEHPGIARLLDAGVLADGRPYMVMEYVAGQALLAHAATLSLRERLQLFQQICAAVIFAHANLVVHRDLKPNNILVTKDGSPKLLDFGIAKLLGSEGLGSETVTGLAPLTPAHAAPEQLEGKPVTTATDVYALGTILYELLTGLSPWEHLRSKSISEALDRMRTEDPPPPSAAAKDASLAGDLDAIVATALRKLPSERYATVNGLNADVGRYLRGEPVSVGPDSTLYRARKFVRRNRLPVAIAATIALLLAAFTWRLANERDRAVAAEQQARQAEARASSEADASKQVSDYLESLFDTASPEKAGGKPIEPRKLLDQGLAQLEGKLLDQPLQRARMLATLGRLYCKIGLPKECRAQLEEAVRLQRSRPDADPVVTGQYLYELGEPYGYARERELAVKTYREALALWEPRLPADDDRIIDVLGDLGINLRLMGKPAEGVAALERVAALIAAKKGERSTGYVETASRLALGYHELGRETEARNLMERALGIQRDLKGPADLKYLQVLHRYATLLAEQGDQTGSERALREVLQQYLQIYGEENAQTSWVENDLAVTLRDEGRPRESADLFRQVIDVERKITETDKPEFAVAQSNYGVALAELGEYDAALKEQREAWAIMERHAQGNPYALRARSRLVDTLLESGKIAEAAALLDGPALETGQGTAGQLATFELLRLRSACARLQGRLDEAVKRADEAQAPLQGLPKGNEWAAALLLRESGLIARARSEPADAVELLTQAVPTLQTSWGPGRPRVLTTKLELADALLAMHRDVEAAALVDEITPVAEKELAPTHVVRVALAALRAKLPVGSRQRNP